MKLAVTAGAYAVLILVVFIVALELAQSYAPRLALPIQ